MGGAKKKTIAKSEKTQQASVEEAPAKKGKEPKPTQQAKRIGWAMPKLSDEQVTQVLAPIKALTLYEVAKALGVKASVAVAVTRNLENRGILKREAGYSGHYVYSVALGKPLSK